MLLVLGTIRIPADMLPRALPAMTRMIEASRAEPGCLHYSYAQDVLDPGLIHVREGWTDRAALDAHFQTKHLRAWREEWPALGIADRELFGFEAVETGRL